MACKLSGPLIECRKTTDIISDGIALGSVQVSSNGQPMIMLSDRQTTGGYAKIGTVISVDIPILAQCKPGDAISFQRITLAEAQKLYRKHGKQIKKFQKKMNRLR
jgi:allophanate hydrolase subunit 2